LPSSVPFPLANPSAYNSFQSGGFSGQGDSNNFGSVSSFPAGPLPVPVPVATPSSYSASPAVVLPVPSSFSSSPPTAPSDFGQQSAYGK
jgi:hypothetical protein